MFVNIHLCLFALTIPPTAENTVIIIADILPETAIPVRLMIDATRKIIKNAGKALSAPNSNPFLRIAPTDLNPPKKPDTAEIAKMKYLYNDKSKSALRQTNEKITHNAEYRITVNAEPTRIFKIMLLKFVDSAFGFLRLFLGMKIPPHKMI